MGDNLNVELLIKIMSMTTSDNDGQALVAVRKANEQLKKWGWTWESILRGKINVAANPFVNMEMEDLLKRANDQAQPAPWHSSTQFSTGPVPPPRPYTSSYVPPTQRRPYTPKPTKPKKPKINLSDLGL